MNVGGEVPKSRAYHTTIFCDSRLLVFGGENQDAIFDDLHIFELGVGAYLPLEEAKI